MKHLKCPLFILALAFMAVADRARANDVKTAGYDVRNLTLEMTPLGKSTGRHDASELTELVFDTLPPDMPCRITAMNGKILRIETTKVGHEIIRELLEQLSPVETIKIILKCHLIEIGAMDLGPMKDVARTIDPGKAKELLRRSNLLASNRIAVLSSRKTECLSRTSTTRHITKDADGRKLTGIATRGVKYSIECVVSADRRSVQLTLSERVADSITIGQIENPVGMHHGAKRDVTVVGVPDRGAVVLRSLHQPQKGKILALIVEPVIRVPGEQE